jgi:hypothetical protein
MTKSFIVVCAIIGLSYISCGKDGGSGPSAPTPTPVVPAPVPAPAPAPTNRNPVITSLNMTAFGVQQLSTFQFSAVANDPDGDAVSYAWDVAGSAFTGSAGSIVFSVGGTGTARVTVTDGKGGSTTDTRTFVVGSMTGRWGGTFGSWIFVSNLVQSYTMVTGDYSDQLGPGRLDPASANTIDANGNVKLRYKQSVYSDFTFTGVMDSTGRRITGVVNGSGYVNKPFTMTK